jgi:hypothetical protein
MCELIVETMLIDGTHTATSFSCGKTGKAIIFSDLSGEYCEEFCGHEKAYAQAAINRMQPRPLSTLIDIRI